jgi:hypothetical protein
MVAEKKKEIFIDAEKKKFQMEVDAEKIKIF